MGSLWTLSLHFLFLSIIIIPVICEQSLSYCCDLGNGWAFTEQDCASFSGEIKDIPKEQKDFCLASVQFCCIKTTRERECALGQKAAKEGIGCASINKGVEKECCESCLLGKMAGKGGHNCRQNFMFSNDVTFIECCEEDQITTSTTTTTTTTTTPTTTSAIPPPIIGDLCNLMKGQLCAHNCISVPGSYICTCRPGFELLTDGKTCRQIDDENKCSPNNQCEHSCVKNGPEEKCLCNLGFILAPDGFSCIEKVTNSTPLPVPKCPSGYFFDETKKACDLLPPEMTSSLKKKCPQGYEYDELKKVCDDIDECSLKLHNCTKDQACTNNLGSFTCLTGKIPPVCKDGFEQNAEGECIDINECLQHIDTCDPLRTACINTPGSFLCVPTNGKTSPCPAGYKINLKTALCEDVDECAEATDGCLPDNEICRNTIGNYECDIRCHTGFEYNIEQAICIDINECTTEKHNCEDLPCINTVGSYRCGGAGCRTGFRVSKGRGQRCVDIDECAERLHNCSSCGEKCINVAGSFLCKQLVCQTGESFNRATCQCEVIPNTNVSPFCKPVLCQPGETFNQTSCQCEDNCLNPNLTEGCTRIVCPQGFKLNSLQQCEDIDECALKTHNCAEDNQCINLRGSFQCTITCAEGFRLSSNQHCVDIDECEEGLNDCKEHQICENTISSYICKNSTKRCGPGFRMLNNLCEDIDECLEKNICNDITEICINELGAYRCVKKNQNLASENLSRENGSLIPPPPPPLGPRPIDDNIPIAWPGCPIGFTRDPITNRCEDINECQLHMHTCLASQRCDNIIGSFHCTREISCGTGYTLNIEKNECEDDDECQLKTDYCRDLGPLWICRNTPGSFRCELKKCPPKYTLSSDGQCQQVDCKPGFYMNSNDICEDIDECKGKFYCPVNMICLNTIGSYVCQKTKCPIGFSYNESKQKCMDIDECQIGILQCGENQMCKNLIGSAGCQCLHGFKLNDNKNCVDIDECSFASNICPVYTQCKNTVGSYVCDCQKGFIKDERTFACKDINECFDTPNICEHNCVNLWGKYQCVCQQGYILNEDNRTCSDIDECTQFKEFTRCVGTCVNTPGSYTCSCPAGYRLGADGGTCQDIDECISGDVCPGQICLNTRGSFKCNKINCPKYFVPDPIHKNRCNRSPAFTCLYGDLSCRDMPMGYSFNFMTFTSNIGIPLSTGQLDLFTMKGPLTRVATVSFEMNLVRVECPSQIIPADETYFRMMKRQNQAVISLVKPIPGPQEVELQLMMKLRHQRDRLVGTHVARLIIFVSEYSF